MKLMVLFLAAYSCGLLAQDIECSKVSKSNNMAEETKINSIKIDYIHHIAREIFNDETKIYDFIGVTCMKALDNKKGIWSCHIRQSATKFNDGKYTVNPPGVGEWVLNINFIDNTYSLK